MNYEVVTRSTTARQEAGFSQGSLLSARGSGTSFVIVSRASDVWEDDDNLLASYRPLSPERMQRAAIASVIADMAPYQTAGWDGEDATAIDLDTLNAAVDLLTDLAACSLPVP